MATGKLLCAEDLLKKANLVSSGEAEWGTAPPSSDSGVYLISVAGIDVEVETLASDLRNRWVTGQTVIYIGRAKRLRKRLQQFYRQKHGAPSPHRGGQSILLLEVPLKINWSVVSDYAAAEHRLIEIFRHECGTIPFGNKIRSAHMSLTAHVSSGHR